MISDNLSTNLATALSTLQCPACTSHAFTSDPAVGVRCQGCHHTLRIEEQLFVVQDQYVGNNRIAAEFYDSDRWDKYRFWKRFTPFNDRAVTDWSREVLKLLPDLSNTRLLDIAIGDGRNMPFIPSDCDVYGIDISAAQLHHCRRRFANRKLVLFQGQAESLPFQDDAFDNVLSFGAFNYFNDPLKSLQEMARVVKPDGLIVVTDEYADLPNRMIGSRLGWPALDHWIMSTFLHLGESFTRMVEAHRDLKIEPIADQVLRDCQIRQVCNGWAYCFSGSPQK